MYLHNCHLIVSYLTVVQLLQQQGALTCDSLRYMAKQVEGSFFFTVLNDRTGLYSVKGDNPLCITGTSKHCLLLLLFLVAPIGCGIFRARA